MPERLVDGPLLTLAGASLRYLAFFLDQCPVVPSFI